MINKILLILLFLYQIDFCFNNKIKQSKSYSNNSLVNINNNYLSYSVLNNSILISKIDVDSFFGNFSKNKSKNLIKINDKKLSFINDVDKFKNLLLKNNFYQLIFLIKINLNSFKNFSCGKILLNNLNLIEKNLLYFKDFIAKFTYFSLPNSLKVLKKSYFYVNKTLFFNTKSDESINKIKFLDQCAIFVFDKNILFGSIKRLKLDTYYLAIINLIRNNESENFFNFKNNLKNNFRIKVGNRTEILKNIKTIYNYSKYSIENTFDLNNFDYIFINIFDYFFEYESKFLINNISNLVKNFNFETILNSIDKNFENILNETKNENSLEKNLKNDIEQSLFKKIKKKENKNNFKRSIMNKNISKTFNSSLKNSINISNQTNITLIKDKFDFKFLLKNGTINEFSQKSFKNNLNSLNQLNTFSSNLTNSINKPFTKTFTNTSYDINLLNTTNFDIEIYLENPEEMLEPWIVNPYFFPIMITYIISFIVGVTGNVLVFWLMFINKENRNVTAMFLVSLSVSDLLLLIIYGPLEITNYFVLQWDKEGTICRLSAFAESVSAFGSVLNLVAVSFERFVVIVFPMQSLSLCAMHNCKRVLIGVWILALFLSTPVLFIKTTINTTFTNYKTTVSIYYCKDINDTLTFTVYVYRFLTLFILPSLIMIVCYTWVIIELWISTKNLENCKSNLKKCTSSIEMNTLSFKYNSSINNKTNKEKGNIEPVANKNYTKNYKVKNENSNICYNDEKNFMLNLIQKDPLSNLVEKNLSYGQLSELKLIDKKDILEDNSKLNLFKNENNKKVDCCNLNSFEKENIVTNFEQKMNKENSLNIEKSENKMNSFDTFPILDKLNLEKNILEIDEFNLELSNDSLIVNKDLNLNDENLFMNNNNLILKDKNFKDLKGHNFKENNLKEHKLKEHNSKDLNLSSNDKNLSLSENINSNNYFVDLNDNLEEINKIIINDEINEFTINDASLIVNENIEIPNIDDDCLDENFLDEKKSNLKLNNKILLRNDKIESKTNLKCKNHIKEEKVITLLMNNLKINENIEKSKKQTKKDKNFNDGFVEMNLFDKNSLNEIKILDDNSLVKNKSLDDNSLIENKKFKKQILNEIKTFNKKNLVKCRKKLINKSEKENKSVITKDEKSLIKEKGFIKENLIETKKNNFKSETKKILNKKEFLRKLSNPSINFSKKIFFNNKNATNKKPLAFNTQTNSQLSSNCSINFNHQQPKVVLRTHFRKEAMDVKSARKQVIKMLIFVVILFLISWGPRLTMEVVIKCCLDVFNNSTYTSRVIFYLLPFIHSCLNPFVYYFMSTKFRKQLIKFWQRLTKKNKLSKKSDNDINKQFSYKKSTFQSENNTSKIITIDTVVN